MAGPILTPSKITDLFGAGLHGFGDDPNPMLATAFDASWCNGIQMELLNIILYGNANGIGVFPDGAIFDQVLTVLKSLPFDGTPSVANGGTFTMEDSSTLVIEADGGNGGSVIDMRGALAVASGGVLAMLSGSTLDVQSGAMVDIKSGGAFDAQDGSTFDLNTNATLATAKQLTLTGTAQVLGGATSKVTAGTIDTIDDTGTVDTGIVDFYTQTGAPPTGNGQMAYGGRDNLTVGGFGGAARMVAIPIEEYLPGPVNTVAGIEDTGLEIAVSLTINDVIYIELDMESKNTSAANDINVRIEVNAVAQGGTDPYRPVAANRVLAVRRVVKYKAAATAVYTIKGRHGAGAGTTTSTNLRLLIRQANDFA